MMFHGSARAPLRKIAAIIMLLNTTPVLAGGATLAPWLTQMGLTASIESAANWGHGLILGDVDTGIVANYMSFAPGQVSQSLSSCAAVSFRCSNGYTDDNGHGTATAEIAAGNWLSTFNSTYGGYTVSVGNQLSMAPDANIVSEKVLNSAGSGTSTDVANGITRAVNAGASVINLSLTYLNTSDLVSALNYAASKGVYVVWAGGNSAQALLNNATSTGLTAAAIAHLIIVGSVNSQSQLSSFSNTPGNGGFQSTTGGSVSYASRWIVAPGEYIVAPYTPDGSRTWAYWSGTSMSTPLVSGSLLLLENTWIILKTNGTAANLLLATAKNLGGGSVNSTYGNGIVNLSAAFAPVGALDILEANGQSIAVTSLTGSLITGGALGNLAAVQSKLANYTAFDSYSRGFSVNLSGLIQSRPTSATVNPLPTNQNTGPVVMKLMDGEELTVGGMAMNGSRQNYAILANNDGATLAVGYGTASAYPYAKTLYGDDNFATLSEQLASTQLSALGEGGGLFSYGWQLDQDTRMAVSWSGTPSQMSLSGVPSNLDASASNMIVGITHKFSSRFTAGASFDMLNEQNSLLGSTWGNSTTLGLGSSNRSESLSLFAGINLTPRDSLLMEAGMARTEAANGSGLIAGTTVLMSQSLGLGLQHQNLLNNNDRLTFSATQPLRVVSGQIGVVMPTVDAVTGTPGYQTQWASAAPTGRERDYAISYATPIFKTQALGLSVGYDQDAGQIQGNNVIQAGVTWAAHF